MLMSDILLNNPIWSVESIGKYSISKNQNSFIMSPVSFL
jgi:hypothetical protein